MPGQTYGYRWFVDQPLRTVFFHDHQYANLPWYACKKSTKHLRGRAQRAGRGGPNVAVGPP